MKYGALMMAAIAVLAIAGMVMANPSTSGAATTSKMTTSCPDGRLQLVQLGNGQFGRVCVPHNEPVYSNSPPLTEHIQRGVPRQMTPKYHRSFSKYCNDFPNACLNE